MLLQNKTNNEKSTNAKMDIFQEAKSGDLKALRRLIGDDAGILCKTQGFSERTPFHVACQNGHLDIVRYITRTCPNSLNIKDRNDLNPLHLACQAGHLHIVEFLIKVNPCWLGESDNVGFLPIHSASLNGHLDVVDYIMQVDPAGVHVMNDFGRTPMDLAALAGHKDLNFYYEAVLATLML